MSVNFYPLARGIASYVLPKSIFKRPGSGGTFSSKYCYSVWLRHLHHLINNNLITHVSELKRVAEIGPGDSLGIGISALFTGATQYACFDVIRHASVDANLTITEELKTLFQNHADIPSGKGFENVSPVVPSQTFPDSLKHLSKEFFETRAREIINALKGVQSNVAIDYVVPWTSGNHSQVKDVDLIFSQAVMEHVSDIEFAYREMYRWLKPGGIISHQIDFKTHEMTKEWNGHWFISDGMWNILAHGRKYPMNRLPLSSHLRVIEQAGFEIRFVLPVRRVNTFTGSPKVNIEFVGDDLVTSGALIQAVKR